MAIILIEFIMKSKNMSVKDISEITGFSEEEIEKLDKNGKSVGRLVSFT